MTDLSLAKDFPAVSREDWRKLVDKALKGVAFDEALVYTTYDDIRVEPLYTADQAITAPLIARHALGWDICQFCDEAEPEAANKAILTDLEGGVTSILLQLAAPGQVGLEPTADALKAALQGIAFSIAPVWLRPGYDFEAAATARTEAARRLGADPDRVCGGFGADPLGALARTGGLDRPLDDALKAMGDLAERTVNDYPRIRTVSADAAVYHDAGASEAQELACLLSTIVAYLRAMDASGVRIDDAFEQMAFTLAADADLLLTIAKFRAARLLIVRIGEACGVQEPRIALHAISSRRMLSRRDANNNMLRLTLACAGAALGQGDIVTVLPFTWPIGRPDALTRRIARNTQIILQEESFLGGVLDPTRGSWAVESLTAQLSAKAWERFQAIEREGGMAQALQSGSAQEAIQKTAEARAADIDKGGVKLTGVTVFEPEDEDPRKIAPHAAPEKPKTGVVSVDPLPLRRLAEPHEQAKKQASNVEDS